MVDVDERLVVLSSKRSTHHAFLEGLMHGVRYIYDNNVVMTKDGTANINRTLSSDEPVGAPMLYVASFERRFKLPDLYGRTAFQELESRHTSPGPVRRVLYLRDPLNTLASTYRVFLKSSYFSDFKYVTDNVRQWSRVARRVLDGGADETFIYANQFWDDADYRNGRLDAIGASAFHASDQLSTFGGGGNTYFGDRKRAVTTEDLAARYLVYAEDERFGELVRQNAELFEAFCEHVGDAQILDALRALSAA